MNKLFRSILLSVGIALLTTGIVQAKDDAKPATSAPASAPADKSKAPLMDINTATEKELATLPKIGDARAKAIVKGRPYKSKDELVGKKILTQDVYNGIKERIIAKQGAKADNKTSKNVKKK